MDARARAHQLLDELPAADAEAVERLLVSLKQGPPVPSSLSLDDAIQAGLDSLAAGRLMDGDEVFDRLDAELADPGPDQ
jgi:hypothetical protein